MDFAIVLAGDDYDEICDGWFGVVDEDADELIGIFPTQAAAGDYIDFKLKAKNEATADSARYELVLIGTQTEAYEEGRLLRHAVGFVFPRLAKSGNLVYSLRLRSAPVMPILTMTARKQDDDTWVCDHVVGLDNRRPTEEELTEVKNLLSEKQVALRYNPNTILY